MSDEPAKIVLGDTAITALERTPGRRWFRRNKERPRALTRCENCGAPLTGHYCAQCGQAAVDYRRSFRHVIADVLESFLNWDSKFFATIALLIFKPWRLTNEFLAGKRVRYVNTLRLYLLASILFFFAVNYGARDLRFEPGKLGSKDRAELEADLKKADLPPAAREELQALLRESSPAPSPTADVASPSPAHETGKERVEYGKIGERRFVVFDSKAKSATTFERWIEGRAKEKMGEHGTKMGLFIATLFSNLPYMMLCCIPLFAFVLQIFLSIRRVYRQGWFFSIFKFLFGGFVYLIVLVAALAATFFVTLVLP